MGKQSRHEHLMKRAGWRCEYCHVPADRVSLSVHVEHVISRQHGGGDEDDNLAIACARCNLLKGPNIAGIDPTTGRIVRLFNPRKDVWGHHFRLAAGKLSGLTAIGRTTVELLDWNNSNSVRLRQVLRRLGHKFD